MNFLKSKTMNVEGGTISNADYKTCLNLCNDIQGNPAPTEGHIYGVKRLRTASTTTWERTDEGRGLTANATHDGSEVTNDFDSLYPWSDIISYSFDSSTQLATSYYGDSDFTFTPESSTVNIFTKLPRFWAQRWIDDNDYEHIQIADYAADGFTEIAERSVARYSYQNSTSTPRSISGKAPIASTSSSSFRAGASKLGAMGCLLDIDTTSVIQMLYLVEYADYNSQDILGYGVCSASDKATAGGCDSLGMKSGCLSNDKTHSVIYRGIEDIIGNIYQYVDGCICSGSNIYVCYDKSNYTDTAITNYTLLGYTKPTSDGYVKTLGYDKNNPFIMLPTDVGGSDSTYTSDYYYYGSGTKGYRFGSRWNGELYVGLFFADTGNAPSYSGVSYGARFMLKAN